MKRPPRGCPAGGVSQIWRPEPGGKRDSGAKRKGPGKKGRIPGDRHSPRHRALMASIVTEPGGRECPHSSEARLRLRAGKGFAQVYEADNGGNGVTAQDSESLKPVILAPEPCRSRRTAQQHLSPGSSVEVQAPEPRPRPQTESGSQAVGLPPWRVSFRTSGPGVSVRGGWGRSRSGGNWGLPGGGSPMMPSEKGA